MSALHKVERADSHVITEVIKTELVVGSEGDVASIGFAALVRIGFMLVDTIDGEAKEHVYRSVPLGVTFGKVIVDSDHVHTFVRQRVEVHRECRHEGFTFTGRHLGNLTLVQNDTTEELDVIVNHIPCDLVSSCHPMVGIARFITVYFDKVETGVRSEVLIHFCSGYFHHLVLRKTTCRRFDDGVGFGQNLVEHFFVAIFDFLLEFIYLIVDLLALFDWRCLDGSFEFGDACFFVRYGCLQFVHERP